MRLFKHTNNAVSLDPYNPVTPSSIRIVFASTESIPIQFPDDNGVPREIDASVAITSLKFELKKLGDYNGIALVSNIDPIGGIAFLYTKTGAGATAAYTINPGFKTTGLLELLIAQAGGSIAARPADQTARYALTGLAKGTIVQEEATLSYWMVADIANLNNSNGWTSDVPVASATLGGEIEVNQGGAITKSQAFSIVVDATYITGTEGLDLTALPTWPAPSTIATQPTDQAAINVSATAAANLFPGTAFSIMEAKVIAAAGAGAYTAAYALPLGSMRTGALLFLNLELPASANPTVEIHDATTGGTLLATVTNPAPAAAAYWFGIFKFGATNWHKMFSAFQ